MADNTMFLWRLFMRTGSRIWITFVMETPVSSNRRNSNSTSRSNHLADAIRITCRLEAISSTALSLLGYNFFPPPLIGVPHWDIHSKETPNIHIVKWMLGDPKKIDKMDGDICFLCHRKTVQGICMILCTHLICPMEINFECAKILWAVVYCSKEIIK